MKREIIILLSLIAVYSFVFSSLSILKHRSFHSTYLDLGLEAQSVWNTEQGRYLKVSFGERGEEISALSYHVSPIVVLLAPLYKLWSSVELLLIFQTLVLALGVVPIYLLSKQILGSVWLSLSLVISYLLYPPLQWSNLTDFHPQTLATTPLLFLFLFYRRKKWLWFFLTFIICLLVKENISLITSIFGLFMIFEVYQSDRRPACNALRSNAGRSSSFVHHIKELFQRVEGRVGVVVLAISLIWFFISTHLVMPFFSGGQMGALGRYEYLGSTPLAVMAKVLTDPVGDLKILLMLPKLKYLFHLLVSAGFLPLLAPQYLLLALSEFFLNLFSAYNPQWQVKFHYTAAITPFIFIAAIYGVVRCRAFLENRHLKFLTPNILISFYLVSISLLWNYVHSPSPLSREFDRSTYTVTPSDVEKEKVLKSIPPAASVSAMNNLGAHLSNRRFLWRFPIGLEKADYIVVDPTLPGINYDLSQIKAADFKELWDRLLTDYQYEISYQSRDLFILKKTR